MKVVDDYSPRRRGLFLVTGPTAQQRYNRNSVRFGYTSRNLSHFTRNRLCLS